MQTAKIHIWLIGVAAIAAPIFYVQPVLAQTSQQGNLVLEMQQLRDEIAELRGMIERQQYEISQLKRASDTISSRPSSSATSASPSSGLYSSALPSTSVVPPSETVGTASSVEGTVISSPQITNQLPAADANEQFYRAYDGDQEIVDENPEVVSAARQARQAADAYPPVVDRSLGGAAPQLTSPPVVDRSIGGSAPVIARQQTTSQPQLVSPSVASAPIDAGVAVVAPVVNAPAQGAASQSLPTANNSIQTAPVLITPADVAAGGVIQVPTQNEAVATRSTAAAFAPVLSEDEYYNQGFELLKQFKYSEAVNIFKQQIQQYPQGGFADDAHYWIAESMYLNRDLPESKRYFRAIIDDFAQSPRLPDAMLKTAYIEQEQGNEIEARILLQEIIQYHPRSDAAISAKNRLEKLN